MNEQSERLQKLLIGLSENLECLDEHDVENFLCVVEETLDELDNYDTFGTEGWRKLFGAC